MPDTGDQAPSFSLPANNGATFSMPNGKPMVLYFYPKDDTPGCTTEAVDFTSLKPQFTALDVEIAGLSPDPAKKHDKFIQKHGLGITLIADEGKEVLQSYGVWVEKSMYGKTYMGVERTTFLIDEKGAIIQVWRKVKAKGHAQAVLEAAQQHLS